MTTNGMETVLNSAVFFVLFFAETIAPICDPDFEVEAGSDPNPWDESPRRDTGRLHKTYNCVWKSWGSWSGCSGIVGTKERLRLKEDDANNCRCDIEFQTTSCKIFGKSPKVSVFLPAGRPAVDSCTLSKQWIVPDKTAHEMRVFGSSRICLLELSIFTEQLDGPVCGEMKDFYFVCQLFCLGHAFLKCFLS